MILNLVTYKSNEIEAIWPNIEPYIKKVLKKIDLWYTVDTIKVSLLNKEMQLWTSYDGTQINSICITRISIHPKYKYLEIVLMAGISASVQFLEQIEDWARSENCKVIRFEGRKGWIKKLPDYSQVSVQLEKEL